MPINVYSILGPIILALILIEFIYCLIKKNGFYSYQDSLIGIGTMMMAQCFNLLIANAVVVSYGWVFNKFSLFHIPSNVFTLFLCYVGVDFLFYWFHRAGHRINILWAAHSPHHSAEELNYAVALRTGVFQRLASFLFYWPLAIVGFSPEIILPIVAMNLIMQFLPHTRVIPKLPKWIDSWMNTPYHHRIHHAANKIYWDKNYGGSFIIWDKLFGTYQDEVETPYYGITVHPKSWDPTWLNFHWFAVLYNDMKSAKTLKDKINVWIKPPGWRPQPLAPYPESKIEKNSKNQIKYQTQSLVGSTYYLLFQLLINMSFLFLIISNQSPLSNFEKFICSLFIWFAVTTWANILESKSYSKILEYLRIISLTILVNYVFSKYSLNIKGLLLFNISSLASFFWLLILVKSPNSENQNFNQNLQVS